MAYGFGGEMLLPAASLGLPGAATALVNLTSGRLGIAMITQTDNATGKTYSLVDNTGSSWTQLVYTNPSRACGIWAKVNLNAGVTAVLATVNSGLVNFNLRVLEFSGVSTSAIVTATDSLTDGVASTVHDCSASGLTTASPTLALACGVLSAGSVECIPSPLAAYDETPSLLTGAQDVGHWCLFPSGVTAEQARWHNMGVARTAVSAMALLCDPTYRRRREHRLRMGVS